MLRNVVRLLLGLCDFLSEMVLASEVPSHIVSEKEFGSRGAKFLCVRLCERAACMSALHHTLFNSRLWRQRAAMRRAADRVAAAGTIVHSGTCEFHLCPQWPSH